MMTNKIEGRRERTPAIRARASSDGKAFIVWCPRCGQTWEFPRAAWLSNVVRQVHAEHKCKGGDR